MKSTAAIGAAVLLLGACNVATGDDDLDARLSKVIGANAITSDGTTAVTYDEASFLLAEHDYENQHVSGHAAAYVFGDGADNPAIVALIANQGTTEDGAVAAIGYALEAGTLDYGGAVAASAGSDVPTSGRSTYAGTYYGSINDTDANGYDIDVIIDGRMALGANFDDALVDGVIVDRRVREDDGTVDVSVQLANIVIEQAKIQRNGTFAIVTSGGEATIDDQTGVATPVAGRGIFGGATGDYAAGALAIDHVNGDLQSREFGVFVLQR